MRRRIKNKTEPGSFLKTVIFSTQFVNTVLIFSFGILLIICFWAILSGYYLYEPRKWLAWIELTLGIGVFAYSIRQVLIFLGSISQKMRFRGEPRDLSPDGKAGDNTGKPFNGSTSS